ncbi:glycosyltransferase family 1 protein [Paenibacillus spiritus]|uniref:Glycosyltransferase family 1 protein n=1 Tax=Paenibacillus spiritus TaxID=2496557 RepID=A0A5J5FUY0_9BACL|nr:MULTISPECIES: glycosyltransferase family 1 protein [Paenibacillus]KAA8997564.1 glycosyltransferase family 1 protein [Paenibacillus spiritus]
MEVLRILQVVTVMNRGGLETMLMNYYRRMDRTRIQFDFMVHRAERGHYDDEIEALGGVIYRMPPIRPGHYRSYFRQLDQFFKEHPSYRVVHSHINENSGFVLRAARRAGISCRIAHSHISDQKLDIKLPFRLYGRMVMKGKPNAYFACSRNAGRWLFGANSDIQSKLVVMNNAVDLSDFAYSEGKRSEVRQEWKAEGRLVIGHVGRFDKQKNHDFLIDIFQQIHSLNPEALLVLAGTGQLEPSIRAKVERLGLSEHVRFLGVRKDISRLMQGMDVFLFPSLFEGLPVVLVEAQAAGLRCVVSDAITAECDLSGRIEFLSLKHPAEYWARTVLSQTCEHADTAELLRGQGYDTKTMSEWLAGFYTRASALSGEAR